MIYILCIDRAENNKSCLTLKKSCLTYIDISYSNVLRLYCCYSMQLAIIVSILVYIPPFTCVQP